MKDYHQSVIEKEEDKALDEAEKEAKATPYYHIPKYERATSQDRSKCVLFLTEGDSAAKPILAARNTKIHGVFPLRGKLLNVISASKKEIGSSAEIQSIMAIMQGLSIRNGVDFKKLRYQEVVVSTDADVDGLHIRGLVCAAFMNLWPEFIMEGRLKYLVTPVVVAKKGKQRFEYFKEKDFEEALHNGMKFDRVKYLKGLGSNDAEAFSEYLNNPKYKMSFTYDDLADISMDLAFNKKRAEDRKPLFDTLSMVDVEEL
jgi:DNA gyrase/topoisomerase IV subunit B